MNKIKIAYNKGYRVSKQGTLIGPRKKEIKGCVKKRGYRCFNMRVDGKLITISAHRLQAYQKFEDALFEDGIVVRHLDNNPLNNSFDNIAIGTEKDNYSDNPKEINERRIEAAKQKNIKYSPIEVVEYHNKTGRSAKKTMAHFGMPSKSSLYCCMKRAE